MIATINNFRTEKLIKQPFNWKGDLPKHGDPINFQVNGVSHEGIVKEVEHSLQDLADSVVHSVIIYVDIVHIGDFIVAPAYTSEAGIVTASTGYLEGMSTKDLQELQLRVNEELSVRDIEIEPPV